MGYRAHKEKAEGKQRRVKRILLSVTAFLLLGLLIFAAFCPPETWKYYVAMPDVEKRKDGELRIHFMDVGQGDSTLIELPDGKVMLIDGGDDTLTAKKQILRYLNALDIDRIDYLVITHTDGDHCGGIEEIVKWKKVVNAYLPATSKTSNSEYAEAYTALAQANCALIESSRLVSFGKDETSYKLTFLYPYANHEELESNEASSVLWLDYMGVSALFMGDAPQEVETLLIRDDKLGFLQKMGVDLASTEILKVAHHGSGYSSSLAFMQYLNVQTAVISCGKDNSYGHPSDRVLRDLNAAGASVYRTDENGHVVLTIHCNKETTIATIKS